MEIIDNRRRRNDGLLVIAIILIGLGLVVLARNLGLMDYWLYRTIVSWQSLLIVLGVWALTKNNTTGGLLLVGTGVFFLIPRIARLGPDWVTTYWPVLLVILGLIVLVNFFRSNKRPRSQERPRENAGGSLNEDGFLNSYNSFGSRNHKVLDPVFRGAKIQNTFGGVALDLRKTFLSGDETVIEVECNFGGVKLFVPGNWAVVDQTKSFFGGTEDKRASAANDPDNLNRLVIRGHINFGGIEIRS